MNAPIPSSLRALRAPGLRGCAVIWFNQPAEGAPADSVDVLAQVTAIRTALVSLGFQTHELPFSLDFTALRARLAELKPEVVINLVESIEENGGYHIVHWSGHGHLNLLELAKPGGASDRLSGDGLLDLFTGDSLSSGIASEQERLWPVSAR